MTSDTASRHDLCSVILRNSISIVDAVESPSFAEHRPQVIGLLAQGYIDLKKVREVFGIEMNDVYRAMNDKLKETKDDRDHTR